MRLGSPSSSSSRTVPRSPPGGARVSRRAGALLGVAGHSLALHRLLLCGSPTYLLLARPPRLEGTRVRLRSRAGAPHQHDAIAWSCVPSREQLCSRTLRQLLQLSVREAVGVVAVAAVAAHPAVKHLKVVGSNRWTGDVECQLGREREGGGGYSADDCWVRGTTRLSWTGAGGGEGDARGREGRPPTPPGSARG